MVTVWGNDSLPDAGASSVSLTIRKKARLQWNSYGHSAEHTCELQLSFRK